MDIDRHYRLTETEALSQSIESAKLDAAASQRVTERAKQLTQGVRHGQKYQGMLLNFMQEFSLSSQEGVALMCLAESLLRIPDTHTVDEMIKSQLKRGDWRVHLDQHGGLFTNAAVWGLMLTRNIVTPTRTDNLTELLRKLLATGGEPLIRKAMLTAMRLLGGQFVCGRTLKEALQRGKVLQEQGFLYSFDMLGEAAMTAEDAKHYTEAYVQALTEIATARERRRGVHRENGISVKLSALHPRFQWQQSKRVHQELYEVLLRLCEQAAQANIGLNIDAEESERLTITLSLFARLLKAPSLACWDGLGIVIQAYQKRALMVSRYLSELAQYHQKRIMVRLVKGAYWDSEIKKAQVEGMSDYPVFTRKAHTDINYIACAKVLLAARTWIYPQFASHNARTVAHIIELAGRLDQGSWEFQCLHGMGESLYQQLIEQYPVRIYAPVGSHEVLLAYLVRRLLENGANSSFVHQITDTNTPVEQLVLDPVERVIMNRKRNIADCGLVLPQALFGETRMNSRGIDFSNEIERESVEQWLVESRKQYYSSSHQSGEGDVQAVEKIVNPGVPTDIVGEVKPVVVEALYRYIDIAYQAQHQWQSLKVEARAACLLRAADLFEQHHPMLLSLLVREAGKTWVNASAELREAVDFLRYYAGFAQTIEGQVGLGVVVCISPWNFPLAIFTGQVAAALMTGNVVLAKPAEQTPLIAQQAVALLHEAGVPVSVLQLVPGLGETVGATCVQHPNIAAVIFTGSFAVAKIIEQSLYQRSLEEKQTLTLIAETGGQNAMIVDSSALAEQVVADVMMSAFDSTGQRCSALRVLCLQNDVAERLLTMLKGACAQLSVGSTEHFENDISAMIDAPAVKAISDYVKHCHSQGYPVFQSGILPAAGGHYFLPTIIEIPSLSVLQQEVFGPVLHVLRYEAAERSELIKQINALGFGLTLGIHSRIHETVEEICDNAHIGNIYVNRNQIGAVVGIQPFGGEGMSGTGPKAGGPLYLSKLLSTDQIPYLPVSATCWVPKAWGEALEWLRREPRLVQYQTDIAAIVAHYAEQPLWGYEVELPGPTGERNCYRLKMRPYLFTTSAEILEQIHVWIIALRSNATAVFDKQSQWMSWIPQALALTLRIGAKPQRAAQLCAEWSDYAQALQEASKTSQNPIPIEPIVLKTSSGFYRWWHFMLEQSISINTTAAGGNATLLSQSE